jgi:hypothetical protein
MQRTALSYRAFLQKKTRSVTQNKRKKEKENVASTTRPSIAHWSRWKRLMVAS